MGDALRHGGRAGGLVPREAPVLGHGPALPPLRVLAAQELLQAEPLGDALWHGRDAARRRPAALPGDVLGADPLPPPAGAQGGHALAEDRLLLREDREGGRRLSERNTSPEEEALWTLLSCQETFSSGD